MSPVEWNDNVVEVLRDGYRSGGRKKTEAIKTVRALSPELAGHIALESGDAQDDSIYTSVENQLASYTAQRDALVAQILPLLESAEMDGRPIPDSLIHQAANLLSSVQAYADGL